VGQSSFKRDKEKLVKKNQADLGLARNASSILFEQAEHEGTIFYWPSQRNELQ